MKTGIVILNYNDYQNTSKMIDQVKDYSCLEKIVIVDNASTDELSQNLKNYESDKVILLTAPKNKGYAVGNNIGLKYLESETDCELAIISNPDVIVSESVIEELVRDIKLHDKISFIGPKILELGSISRGWKHPTYWTELLSNINFISRFSKKMQKYPEEYYQNGLNKVDVIHGCFFLGRLKDFKKIHYFDPKTFLYYEENILAKKAEEKELGIYVDTRLSVTHELSKSVDKSLRKVKKYKILKESQNYYLTNYMKITKIQKLLIRLFYYISLGICYLTFWI